MTTPGTTGEALPPPLMPRSLVILLGAGAAVLVLAGIRAVAWLVGPVFLALILVIVLSPVQTWLRRRGWPSWLTTLVLVLSVTGVLVVLGLIVVVSIARLGALVPQYADRSDDLMTSLSSSLEGLDVAPGQLADAVDAVDPAKVVTLVGTLLGGLAGAASSLVFLLCLMFFLSVEAGGIDRRLAAVATDRPELATALRSFAHGTRSYLLVSTVFGLVVAVLDGIALVLIGVPLPLLWALLAFITNYVPNVGFVIGLVPPALLALLTSGVPDMLLVIAVYSVLNFVIQSLIQPRYVGDSVGLAMTTTFVALVFWAWLLGPLGALLAIPLTLLAKALLVDVDPTARWATALAGSLAPDPRATAPREPTVPHPRWRSRRSRPAVVAAAPRPDPEVPSR
jgi:AI-2 transport protein TqsA